MGVCGALLYVRTWKMVRMYFQDTWRINDCLTLDYGLAWNVDRFKNYDLKKPSLLAPILGEGGLGPTRKQWKNFSPVLGFAWAPAQDKKTVVRVGAGIYYDFFFGANIDNERALLAQGPPARNASRAKIPVAQIEKYFFTENKRLTSI